MLSHFQARQLFSSHFDFCDNYPISSTLKVLLIQPVYLKQQQSLKFYFHKLLCYSDQILTLVYIDCHYTPIQKIYQGQICTFINFNAKIQSPVLILTANKNSRIQVTDIEKISNLSKLICDKKFMQAYPIQLGKKDCKTFAQILNKCSTVNESQQFVKVYVKSCVKCKKSVYKGKCRCCRNSPVKEYKYCKAIAKDHTTQLQATIFQPQIHQKIIRIPQTEQVLIKLKSFTNRGCLPRYRFLNHCIIQISPFPQTY